ncbi:RNA polymerase sigma-54 factor RpoN [Caballeronia glathei]|jgi:RNA polymerase sigma-70 factor (ECF subfamily)|nr:MULTISPECIES: sigma-70 family RNA polymerase sigma factor [Burkholderiaceae]TCK38219.1 RNA polymerase sigma-70 factor (ECF subfamily) [Paraburkholderia sp. BL8N3]CDY76004.1 RNA polymerase sigma-54 factor RpoN [Caballeronia glathei]
MGAEHELLAHVPRLRRYARALVRNPELADDLVQDTLERALRNFEKFEAGSDLRAWLFTIMHNLFLGQIRKASARASHVALDDEGIAEREFATQGNQADRLEVRDLDYALQRLPIDQREVVLLIGLEGMSYTDVALTLEIPLGTVMSRLSRGRERLRALMGSAQPARALRAAR